MVHTLLLTIYMQVISQYSFFVVILVIGGILGETLNGANHRSHNIHLQRPHQKGQQRSLIKGSKETIIVYTLFEDVSQ
jgi:hypothetical protein